MAATVPTDEESFYQRIRYLQRRTRCSDVVCKEFEKVYREFSQTPVQSSLRTFDKSAITKSGCDFIALHGCPNCNRHVYKPTDEEQTCPICNHSRFDNEGHCLEVILFLFFHICA